MITSFLICPLDGHIHLTSYLSFIKCIIIYIGSLLIPVAHFGGVTFGSDIDIKALRGWGKSTRKGEKQYQSHQSVAGNMKEYGLDQG